MKISFHVNSMFINILTTLLRSIVFNSSFILIFGVIYALLSKKHAPLDDYFILSARTQFLIPTPTDHLNNSEKNAIFIHKALSIIGFAIIIIRFFINLFK